jgi:hypothetical protein
LHCADIVITSPPGIAITHGVLYQTIINQTQSN